MDRFGNPLTMPARETLGFVPQVVPDVEQEDIHGIRPPEVHPPDFYDVARMKRSKTRT